ncbi:MAG TPA: alpha/beta hydrolase [Microlunatus sp.]|nr:alpha/beta hydrolase [Microlunatus sp.]
MTGVPKPTLRQKLWGWLLDYLFVARWTLVALLGRGSSDQLLHPVGRPRSPVLLVPGVFESWRFLQPVAQHLYRQGHPVHVLDGLGYNTGAISDMADIAADYLERTALNEVTIVAHSKGGLIAKHALRDPATLARVRHVIAVNTPFSGSSYASWFLLPSVRMFAPNGPVIRALSVELAVNQRISSLYSVFDPHIPESSCLEGAENIVLPTIGHFRPLGVPSTLRMITAILERSSTATDGAWTPEMP